MKFSLKKYVVAALIAFAVITAGVFAYRGKGTAPNRGATPVERKNLTQEVTVSGTVKAVEAVELGFEKTGRVQAVYADVGDRVFAGQTLVLLESGVENSAVEDALAKQAAKQAHYDNLKAGASAEEVRIKESGLQNARADLATEYADAPNVILDAFNKADNAVHRQADTLFSNAYSPTPKLSFTSSDQQAVYDAENGRYAVETVLTTFKKLAQTDANSDADKETALAQVKIHLTTVNDFLIKTNRALNAAVNLSDTALAAGKDALATARTNINTALSSVTATLQGILTGKIKVETAAGELAQTKAGATKETLAGALADVASAEASVKNARALLAKTRLISPIAGLVTRQDARVGEIAAANASLAAVASSDFKVEAFVPEVDVAKVGLGNPAAVTLDAYGSGAPFPARVTAIDPAETVIDGVSTYKTTLRFNTSDPRIRSGLTANITLTAAVRERALTIPVRAVFEKDGNKFVRVVRQNGTVEEREVKTGLKGSEGEIEITEGLAEGERVITETRVK